MLIKGYKLDIYAVRKLGVLRSIHVNPKYIMLETIDETDDHISTNLCFSRRIPYTEEELTDLLELYDNYIKPYFCGLSLYKKPVFKENAKYDFSSYFALYDIPEETIFYLKLKNIFQF